MLIEKFNKDGNPGVRFQNAQFACSRNYNGCNFDALEVFNIDNPPKSFNKSHNSTVTLQAEFESAIKPEINGKLLTFKADIVSFDPYIVENAEKVTGFSPELLPTNKPIKNDKGERFYGTGGLNWTASAVLFGEPAGFVGVDNNFTLEKFSLNEDVLILEEFNLTDNLKDDKNYLQDEVIRMSKKVEELSLAITALTEAGLEFFKKDSDLDAEKAEELDKVLVEAEAKTSQKSTPEQFTKAELEKFEVANAKTCKSVADQSQINPDVKKSLINKLYSN